MTTLEILTPSGWRALDISERVVIAVTYSCNNIGELESRQSNYSEQFTLPLSNNNRRLLGFPDSVNSFDLTPQAALPCQILVDSVQTVYGRLYIDEVEDDITVSIIGGNIDFFALVEGLTLADLDSSGFDHLYTLSDIAASQTNTWERGYTYPLINFGRLHTDNGQDPYRRLEAGLTIEEMAPCFFVKKLLYLIAGRQGFLLKGSFVEPGGILEQLLITPEKAFGYTEAYTDARSCKVSRLNANSEILTAKGSGSNNNQPFSGSIFLDNDFEGDYTDGRANNYNPVTGFYTADQPMLVRCSISLPFDKSALLGKCEVRVFLERGSERVGRISKEFGSGFLSNADGNVLSGSFPAVQLSAGQTLRLYLEMDRTSDIFDYNLKLYLDSRAFFEVEMLPNLVAGAKVETSGFVPDMSQTDLLLSLANQFNLLFKTDAENKILYIDRFEEVTARIPRAIDWSKKVDYTLPPKMNFRNENYGQRSKLKYAESDGFGDGILLVNNAKLEGDKDVFESEFGATPSLASWQDNKSMPYVPLFKSKDNKTRYRTWSGEDTYSNTPVQDYVWNKGRYFKALVQNIGQDKPPIYDDGSGQINNGEWLEVSYSDILDLFDSDAVSPRMLIRTSATTYPVKIFDGSLNFITISQHVEFEQLTFDVLLRNNYPTLINAFAALKYITPLILLTERDIERYTNDAEGHLLPVYIESSHPLYSDRLSGYFYVSEIKQFQHGAVESCYCELLRIDTPPLQSSAQTNQPQETGSYLLLESGDRLLQENGSGILL